MSSPTSKPRARFPAHVAAVQGQASATQIIRPQRPLSQAAADSQHTFKPKGVGLDSFAVRQGMVNRLRRMGGFAESVLQAFENIPRHLFVDSALVAQAYEDTSLPIGMGQTISKPSVVARMLTLLLEGSYAQMSHQLGRVMEIGTGCGYQAALICQLATHLVSIERIKPLHDAAVERMEGLGLSQCCLLWGDGMLGYPSHAPFQSIIAAAGGDELPQPWLDQLAVGGRLVAPVYMPSSGGHVLLVVDRTSSGFIRQYHDAVHFVPLRMGTELC